MRAFKIGSTPAQVTVFVVRFPVGSKGKRVIFLLPCVSDRGGSIEMSTGSVEFNENSI